MFHNNGNPDCQPSKIITLGDVVSKVEVINANADSLDIKTCSNQLVLCKIHFSESEPFFFLK